ncbi:MAG: glycerol-3-phosphate 1-O-acyltransferase PlsY [Gammaproteobacteria bacterium]|nr:glycerol-3-phosphate 1-O-acyltransferase PlsY [Gammaproteobacteria bacterium]
MLFDISLIFISYLIGSVSTAIIVCRIMRLPDPRTVGSNNPGATNVLRVGGKKAAAMTLIGDSLKGLIPVFAAKLLGAEPLILALIAISAFLGHIFPVFFSFKGGKGVATFFGAMLALHHWIGLLLLATWLLVAYGLKISSLSALIAAILAPFYFYFFQNDIIYVWMSSFFTISLLLTHHSNIKKLITGEESKI